MGKKYVIDEDTLKSIADGIRENSGIMDAMTPAQMAENIDVVYAKGEDAGVRRTYDEAVIQSVIPSLKAHNIGLLTGKLIKQVNVASGQPLYDQGKQEAYDVFWDNFQQNGNRTNHYNGFSGHGWNKNNFKPKYDIKPTGNAYGIFMYSRISGDLVEIAEEQGIEIDFSNVTSLQYSFATTLFTRLGVINAPKSTTFIRAFEGNDYLKTIDKIITGSDGKANFSNAFNGSGALENVRFEGVIGTSVSFSSCPLTKESILSIITHLSGTSSSQTLTLKSSAVGAIDWSNTVIDGVTYNTFDEICDLKPNWTISLV